MIVQIIADMGAWSWFIGGVLLLIGEIFISGTFLVWFGLAAMVIGTVTLVFLPDVSWWSWQIQMIAFGVLSFVFLMLGKHYFPNDIKDDVASKMNDPLGRFVGSEAVLLVAIENGSGRVHLGDTTWRVRGNDMPAGAKIRVTGSDGSSLLVEAV
ncbi:MAG: NfeD family protein [Rhizobiaceae bacterium]